MHDGPVEMRCEARGWRFDLRFDQEIAQRARLLFASLERTDGADGRRADADFTVRRRGGDDPAWAVLTDDQLMMQSEQLSEALHALMVFINQGVIDARNDLLSVHAAAISRGGSGVLLPGASGSGKTTLCARLLQLGAGYLSDDSVAVDSAGQVLAYPRPLAFKWGTGDRFSDIELRDLELDPGRQFVWQVPPARLGASLVRAVAPVLVVAPRFEEGAPLQLDRLARHDGAERLFSQVQNLAAIGVPAALERVGEVVAHCESVAVTYGDAREAATEVFEMLVAGRDGGPAHYQVIPAREPPAEATAPHPVADVSSLCFEDGALLVRATSGRIVTVDGNAARLWPLLDGCTSLSDLATDVSAVFDVPVDEAAADIETWVDHLVDLGVLQAAL